MVSTGGINFHTDQKPLLVLPGRVNKREADLIIDTGAEVTVISERIASKFKHQPEYREVVNLVGAVPGSKAEAKLAKNLEFKFGSSTFYWDVYVAPIEEDAILGLDFLMYHKAKVDLANHELCINGISHGAKQRCDNTETFKVSRIAVAKRTVVPPQTTVQPPASEDPLCRLRTANRCNSSSASRMETSRRPTRSSIATCVA